MAGRVKVELTVLEDSVLPFNYNHALMGWIYRLMGDIAPDLASELHSSKSPKPFTFSNLRGSPSRLEKGGMFFEEGTKLVLIFSSWIDEVIDSFLLGLTGERIVEIAKVKMEVSSFRFYDSEISDEENFVLLSPLVLSEPVERNGKLLHKFLGPKDVTFTERFVDNLVKKFEFFTKKRAGALEIKPDWDYIERRRTSKLVDIKGTKVRGHVFPFRLKGDRELIEFGYYAGFGERTAQGFGCAEVLKG